MAASQEARTERDGWVRPASKMEVLLERISHHQMLMLCYKLSLSTDQQLTPHHVRSALTHLYRKAPNLRVRFSLRDGCLWFKEMGEDNIDFQVVEEASVEEVTEQMHTRNCPSSAPWCCRLLPVPQPVYCPARFSSFIEELQHDFPHCYHLIFGFHHGMGDGTSYGRIVADFVGLLDGVMSGQPIDDQEQLGDFTLNNEFDDMLNSLSEEIKTNSEMKQKLMDEACKGVPEKSLLHSIKSSSNAERKTLLLTQSLDKKTTDILLKRCKQESVTANSAFTAISNLAFVDLLKERGVKQDSYTVTNAHLMNTRRFWDSKEAASKCLSCYIATTPRLVVETPSVLANTKQDFWKYAQQVHQDIYRMLRSDNFLHKVALVNLGYETGEQYNDHNLTFNTKGDVTASFSKAQHIQATQFVTTSSIHTTDIVWDHIILTIHGRFSHTLKYNSGLVDEKTVSRYCDLIYTKIHEIVGED